VRGGGGGGIEGALKIQGLYGRRLAGGQTDCQSTCASPPRARMHGPAPQLQDLAHPASRHALATAWLRTAPFVVTLRINSQFVWHLKSEKD
jgi:hypothetical protein